MNTLGKRGEIWVTPSYRAATGADGRALPLLGYLDLAFKIGNKKFRHRFTVCQGKGISVVLGLDFLGSIKSNVSLENNLLTTCFGNFPLNGCIASIVCALSSSTSNKSTRRRSNEGTRSGNKLSVANKYAPLRNDSETENGETGTCLRSQPLKKNKLVDVERKQKRGSVQKLSNTRSNAATESEDGVYPMERDTLVAQGRPFCPNPVNDELVEQRKKEDLEKFPEIPSDDPRIQALIAKHTSAIVPNKGRVGAAEKFGHRVELTDYNATIYHRVQHYNPHQRQALREQTQHWLATGVIELSNSRHNQRLVFVPKENGGTRICLDMKDANKLIKRVHYPLPTQTSCFERLQGCKYFSKVDLNEAFLQIPLHPDSRDLFSLHHSHAC